MPLWIEPKDPAALHPVQRTLLALRDSPPIVWKQPLNFDNFPFAKAHGWRTWGYVLKGPDQQGFAKKFAPDANRDMVGAWADAADEEVSAIVKEATAAGKVTVMWPITDPEVRDRAVRLGCGGLMVSGVRDLVPR